MTDNVEKRVLFTPNSADALDQIRISKGYSETDAINRAVQLSALVERKRSEGFTLAFAKVDRNGNVEDLELVKVLDGS